MVELLSPEKTIRELFATTDAKDVDANAAYLTDDIELRFGNNEPVDRQARLCCHVQGVLRLVERPSSRDPFRLDRRRTTSSSPK